MGFSSVLIKFLCFLGIILDGVSLPPQENFRHKLFEVEPKTNDQIRILLTLAQQEDIYDFVNVDRSPHTRAKIMVEYKNIFEFQNILNNNNIEYTLLSEDVSRDIEKNMKINLLLRQQYPYRSGEGHLGTERYYTHNEINEYIDDLAKLYPSRAFVKKVGRTYEGRPLKTITITNGDGRPGKNVILVDGGFHAREWISPAAVVYAIGELVENFEENADLLHDYDWIVLPVVNADGYEYTQISSETRSWRKTRKPSNETCIGTDPNRNFDFQWAEEGASMDPCSNTFAGPHAFSEPEAIVVRDIMHSLKGHGIMYLTVHSYGNLLLYPWGYAPILPDTWEDLHEVGQVGAEAIFLATGTNYTVGSSTLVLYAAAGASDDYAFSLGFPLSYTMELSGGGASGFDPPPSSIDPIVKETWVGVRAMAERVVQKYPLIV